MTGTEKGVTADVGEDEGRQDIPMTPRDTGGVDVRGVLIVILCLLLGLAIVFLGALQAEQWVARAGERLSSWQRQIEPPRKAPPASMPIPVSVPRPIPPRDPAKANMRAKGNPGLAFSQDNYPAEALRRSEQGRVVTTLLIDATGAVADCSVTTSSGSSALDEATCRIARKRVRYEPARDAEGNAIASSVTLPVRWAISP